MADETFEKVKQIILESIRDLDPDKITLDARVKEDLAGDSLEVVLIVQALEDEYGRHIPDEDADKLVTVQDVVDYIEAGS